MLQLQLQLFVMNDLQRENRLQELIELYKETKDERYLEEIFKMINKLLFSLAKQYERIYIPYNIDDLMIESKLAILNSINRYIPSEDAKFSTYAYRVAQNRLNSILKKYTTKKRYAGYFTTLETNFFRELTFADYIGAESNDEELREFNQTKEEMLRLILSHFSAENALILLQSYYNLEVTLVCDCLDLSRKQFRDVRQRNRQIVNDIK